MNILCIDPGPKVSGVVVLCAEDLMPVASWPERDNDDLIRDIDLWLRGDCSHLAIEAMAGSYGTTVGASVVQTIIWTGRLMQHFGSDHTTLVYRPDVKRHLADNQRANDAAIRQKIIDRYPGTGGGARPQIGTKAKPGPLYGIGKHAWPALAVGITYMEALR